MICLICRQAELVNGFTSVTLERDEIKLTAKNVPAFICPSCGDACVSEDVAVWLLSVQSDWSKREYARVFMNTEQRAIES